MAKNNRIEVPEAKYKLTRMKQEIANELGITLKEYNGDLTSRQAGKIGGTMVKRMIEYAEQNMK